MYGLEFQHFKQLRRLKRDRQHERRKVQKALWRLEKAELVSIKREGEKRTYHLTPQGWIRFALRYSSVLKHEAISHHSPQGIRKGSYVIIFDIPEKYRKFRDTFRRTLTNLGCTPLQKSIFQTKNDATIDFIARMVANCELDERVKILLVKEIL